MKLSLLAIVSAAVFPLAAVQSRIIAPGATLQKLGGDFRFTEGAASDSEGNVYFSDQPNDRILKWSTEGKLTTFLEPAGRANGLCFDKAGNLWACADGKNELWRIDSARKIEVVLKDYKGKLMNGPNDVWIRPDGGLYFSDPYYQRDYWSHHSAPQDKQCVYFLTPDHQRLIRVAEDLEQPNGLIGSADGKTLYIADLGAHKTYRYQTQPDGSLTDKTLFCEMGSDGMTLDAQGNVYLTTKGVTVFDAAGKKIEQIDVPGEAWTGNVCFGGKDRKTLFITASKGLYAMQMNVAGIGSQ